MERMKQNLFLSACQDIADALDHLNLDAYPIYLLVKSSVDGIAAAAIFITFFIQQGIPFHLRFSTIQQFKEQLPERECVVLILDMGTEDVFDLLEWNEQVQIIVIDHHAPIPEIELSKNLQILTPHAYSDQSLDVSEDISTAGIAYFIITHLIPENTNLAPLAIIGALGEKQDLQGEYATLTSLNERIVMEAKKNNLLSDQKSVWFPRRDRSVVDVLQQAGLPDLTTADAVRAFLGKLGIPTKTNHNVRSAYNLTEEEYRILTSELATSFSIRPEEIIKTDYQLLTEKTPSFRDARDFAMNLMICCEEQRPDIGLALALGDREEQIREFHLLENQQTKK